MAGITMPGDGVFHDKTTDFPIDANSVPAIAIEDAGGKMGLPAVQSRKSAAGNFEVLWNTKSATLQNAVSVTGNGTEFTVDGYGVTTVQITGTFTATVTFEVSVDGTNFIAVNAYNRNTGTVVSSATAAGIFEINTRGIQKVRCPVAWTSGTSVTVVARAEPLPGSNHSIQLSGSNVEGTLDAAAPVKANLAGGKYIATSPTYHDGDLVPLRTNVRAEQIVQPSNPIDRILVTADQTIEPGLSYSLTLTNNTAGTYEECWLEFYSTNGTPGAAYASYVDSDTSNWQNILASYDLTTTLVGTTTKKTGRVIVTPTYIRMSIRNTHVSESMTLYNACMALKKAS